ncbi:stage III sporulation protein AB [Polycladomyces sp. WAk]|uniref:Stage III sporulation protein AB n=1 Tax=Polycladomyces zharkentensis TaxID=2807616 RepID=A0ABS2WK10_9BACL|nr:stage III sporulation protein SpoIIIAB [Polycladomyces sp. WAk]MBN2909864.1 stage III sporulation protein AB [Polycladomyces sp. WAk]
MLKLLGAVFILVASSTAGFRVAKRYADRPRQIRALLQSLAILETEIVYGSRPLAEVMIHIADREPSPVGTLFRECGTRLRTLDGATAYECWRRAIEATWEQTALRQPEREILLHFGQTLGVSDRQDQLQHIRMAMAHLQAEEQHARDDQARYEKMCKSLGVLGGALLVILMY